MHLSRLLHCITNCNNYQLAQSVEYETLNLRVVDLSSTLHSTYTYIYFRNKLAAFISC